LTGLATELPVVPGKSARAVGVPVGTPFPMIEF
jgi:hypothetical protein